MFAECGLFLFFMPGDSLLFTVGLFAARGDLDQPLWLICVILAVAAFLGNVCGYEIGRRAGPALFKPGSRIFKPKRVDQTVAFFDHYGGRAILLARFVPIVRTFVTLVAGVAEMPRRVFLFWTGLGAVIWGVGVTLLGHWLGGYALIRDHLEALAILVVLVSVIPMGIEALRARRRMAAGREPATSRVLDEDAAH
ncbi:hypothetical protein GCM10025868_25820 [Angustibacter aerolatus]|uniref:VTT domain-containing protein n=1 Tax=Angustibacter aerolatus TaxID=1162965 RepID=A0ABQ6JKD9_9ACTN|nr:DedA family protein [Angustibacter aerolatus]GMA87332.1 hypothetical protein GCM10025868_25820 [Angustibacter aerolatus]